MKHTITLMEKVRKLNLETNEWEENWDYDTNKTDFDTFEEVVQYLANEGYVLPIDAVYSDDDELTQAVWVNIVDRSLAALYVKA